MFNVVIQTLAKYFCKILLRSLEGTVIRCIEGIVYSSRSATILARNGVRNTYLQGVHD